MKHNRGSYKNTNGCLAITSKSRIRRLSEKAIRSFQAAIKKAIQRKES